MIDEQILRQQLNHCQRIVIKVGTHVLVDKNGRPNQRRIKSLTDSLICLHRQGKQVVLVSSGAIGVGVHALKMKQRPTLLPELQMAAAVGQTRLLACYNKYFLPEKIQISQVLLTHDDLRNRKRHLNARNALRSLLKHRIIPIINENDVVAVDEIKVGDNDVLSSLVSILLEAELLIMLTTPDGLRKPINKNKSQRVPFLTEITPKVIDLTFGKSSSLSTGGMASKLQAAKMAATTGIPVVIASGFKQGIIDKIIAGKSTGTLIANQTQHRLKTKRKHWLSYFHKSQGSITVDAGAAKALLTQGKSLLSVGIKAVEGNFNLGAMVNINDTKGNLLGQGLVEYNSKEINLIKGEHTREIKKILGYKDYDEVIHRDNLVIQAD